MLLVRLALAFGLLGVFRSCRVWRIRLGLRGLWLLFLVRLGDDRTVPC